MKGSLERVSGYNIQVSVTCTHTLRPGESSVYSLSMVFDEPPAPAARDEFGLDTVVFVARRLARMSITSAILTRVAHRIAAPGGRATAEAERPLATVLGASESD